MKSHIEEELVIRKYLLGEVSAEEERGLEERQFLEHDYFQQVQAAEDDLIDEYLYGDLTLDERERFEKHFLSKPERRDDFRAAQALQLYLTKNAEGSLAATKNSEPKVAASSGNSFWSFLRARRPVWQFSLAAIAVLVALGGLGLIVWSILPKNQSAPSQARQQETPPLPSPSSTAPEPNQNATPQRQETINHKPQGSNNSTFTELREPAKPLSAPPANRPKQPVLSFLLLPIGAVRGEGKTNEFRFPDKNGVAEFRLPLVEETEYKSYRVALLADEKKAIHNWDRLTYKRGEPINVISVRVPTKLLRQGKYSLVLSGVALDGTVSEIRAYPFQVTK